MKTIVYLEGLPFDKTEKIIELPGAIDDNLKRIKSMYRNAYCESGDVVKSRLNPIPGGAMYEGYSVYVVVEVYTTRSDYSYICIEVK